MMCFQCTTKLNKPNIHIKANVCLCVCVYALYVSTITFYGAVAGVCQSGLVLVAEPDKVLVGELNKNI